jgi:Tol biopolymer transport system component
MSGGLHVAAALADRYRIERELGAGGMATVYLAHDVRHDRQVAVKVLHPELAAVIGADRFLSEIRTTANLQHPHILPLFDSGSFDGVLFYVMPFVEGETVRDRLNREKQLPIPDAVRIAGQVASALDYAHRRGVIHRDIKPENILLHDGSALVADFGIALAASRAGGTRMTETGMSLGTPHYMSPEQAMGEREITARSDVYALGAVTYEMLTGDPPFTGSTAQAIVAKVMTEKPVSPSRQRDTVPEAVEEAVLTALQKLPADRYASAAEFAAALHLEAAGGTLRRTGAAAPARPPLGTRMLWPAAALLAAGLAVWGWLRPVPPAIEAPPSRLAIPIPNLGGASTSLQRQIGLTPDGRTLLYTAIAADGENRTMRLDLADTAAVVVPGVVPFLADYAISPDGQEFVGGVGFARMYQYPIGGGGGRLIPPDINPTSNVVWDRENALWFSATSDVRRGIARLDSDGTITRPFGTRHADLLLKQLLAEHTALAVRQPLGTTGGPLISLDLRTGDAEVIIDRPVLDARYTAGYLVLVMPGGALEVAPFDARRGRLTGTTLQIASGVTTGGAGVAQLAVSENGMVAYIPEEARGLMLVDRAGNTRLATPERRNFHAPSFSPDGRRIATDFNTADGRDVWILDLSSNSLTRATFERDGHDATWVPDGESLTFASSRSGLLGIHRTRPGRPDETDSLLASPQIGFTGYWLPDAAGLVIAANSLHPGSRGDIGLVTNGGRGPIEPLVATRFEEQHPAVSPDGRWLALTSDQSGRNEVYLRPLQREGDLVQVSVDGGNEPVWAPDGRELFYRAGVGISGTLTAARVQTSPRLAIVERRPLFPVSGYTTGTPHSNYDVSPDGRTFVFVGFNQAARVVIIQNLPALVERLQGAESAVR